MASIVARRSLHKMRALRLASHLSIRCPLPERRLHTNSTRGLLAASPFPASRRELSVVRGSRGGMDSKSEEQVVMDSKKRKQEEVSVDSKIEQEEKPDVGVQEGVDSKMIEQEEKPDVGVQEDVDRKIEQEERPDVGVQEGVDSKIEQEEKPDVGVQEGVDSKMIEQEEKHDVEEQVTTDSKKIEQEEKNDSEAETESEEEEDIPHVERPVGKRFRLNGSCTLVLQRGDITKWSKDGKSDAIVNAANERMLGGGGVDGAIHRAAGRGLLEACLKAPEILKGVRCPVGRAVITPGFNLPVSQVIHTVGPMYYSEGDPASVLAKAYKNSVNLAVRSGVKYIAFPAISCGIYGYPSDKAAEVSIKALQDSAGQLSEVHFVLFEAETYRAWIAEAEEKLERLTT